MRQLLRRTFFSLSGGILLLAGVEIALRIFAPSIDGTIEAVSFTFPLDDWESTKGVPILERHPRLFWRPKPNLHGHNSRGIFGPEFEDEKAVGTIRVVSLGDSCTHFGPAPYPELLQRLLDDRDPGRFEVINAAVVGWSSHQGLVRLREEVSAWQPDLVTVYFGWNDHWRALGRPDRLQPTRASWRLHLARQLSRLQLVRSLRSLLPEPAPAGLRVELPDYADNLRAMKREGDRLGAELFFLTAPHALDLGIPRFLVDSGEVTEPERLVELHRAYNEVVRLTASELGARLIDLERELDALPKEQLFERDHIHLSELGRSYVARRLMAEMTESGLIDQD